MVPAKSPASEAPRYVDFGGVDDHATGRTISAAQQVRPIQRAARGNITGNKGVVGRRGNHAAAKIDITTDDSSHHNPRFHPRLAR